MYLHNLMQDRDADNQFLQ